MRGGVMYLVYLPTRAIEGWYIYKTNKSNIVRDHMAGWACLPIPTSSLFENILALRSHIAASRHSNSPTRTTAFLPERAILYDISPERNKADGSLGQSVVRH